MDRQMGRWIDKWMDGWTDRQMDEHNSPKKKHSSNSLQMLSYCYPIYGWIMARCSQESSRQWQHHLCVWVRSQLRTTKMPSTVAGWADWQIRDAEKMFTVITLFWKPWWVGNGKHYSLIYVFGQILTQHFLTLKVSNTFSVRKPHQ